MGHLHRLWKEEAGEDLVEYVLVAALIALVVVAAVKTLGRIKAVK
jgi:Flp pilus assembly pilin Flp